MWFQFISLIAIGLSVGWLAGLSVSPVATTIISGLLGLVGGLGAGAMLLGSHRLFGGVTDKARDAPNEIDLRPAATLSLAIAIAVPAGIMARTHHIFYDRTEDDVQSQVSQAARPDWGVLFSGLLDDCAEIIAASYGNDADYFRQLVQQKSELGARLERELPLESLRTTVRVLCADSR